MLEAVVICLDNSDWARNRDCPPSRLQAQQEAAIHLANSKLQANPENSIGLVAMGGEHVEVKASPSGDIGAFHEAIQSLSGPDGKVDIVKGVQTAHLALKHRLNRNQRQRIVLFVCSPLDSEVRAELERVGKGLKKNNVCVDIVSFGEVAANSGTLKALYTAVDANSNSSLTELQFPLSSLTRALANSAVYGSSGGASTDQSFGGSIDPSADPELLIALRLSLEEERARQQQQQQQQQEAADRASHSTHAAVIVEGDSYAEVVREEDRAPTAISPAEYR